MQKLREHLVTWSTFVSCQKRESPNLSIVARGHFKFESFLVQEEGISLVFGVESRRLSRVTPQNF